MEDATEGGGSSEELYCSEADEAAGFIIAPRSRDVEELDDSESNPEADAPAFVDAAPSPSPSATSKQPKRRFADKDDLLS